MHADLYQSLCLTCLNCSVLQKTCLAQDYWTTREESALMSCFQFICTHVVDVLHLKECNISAGRSECVNRTGLDNC